MSLQYFSIIQQGESHKENNTVCQDACDIVSFQFEKSHNEGIICAIADGVGSCFFSDIGSKKSVRASIDIIKERLEKCEIADDEHIQLIIQEGFYFAVDQLLDYAQTNQYAFPQLDTTLTVAVYPEFVGRFTLNL